MWIHSDGLNKDTYACPEWRMHVAQTRYGSGEMVSNVSTNNISLRDIK